MKFVLDDGPYKGAVFIDSQHPNIDSTEWPAGALLGRLDLSNGNMSVRPMCPWPRVAVYRESSRGEANSVCLMFVRELECERKTPGPIFASMGQTLGAPLDGR